MHNYHFRQASMPHFSGHARQRGSCIGSLALGVGSQNEFFLLPAVKTIGKEFFVQSLPELMEVASKKKSFKRAAKSALKNTAKKNWVEDYVEQRNPERKPVDANESYREVGQNFLTMRKRRITG